MTDELEKEERTAKQWQEDQALARFQMISPLLDESLDQAKRIALREQLSICLLYTSSILFLSS